MSTWNYRVMRHQHTHTDGEVETTYAIHEVYYDEEGKVKNWTKEPTGILSDSQDFKDALEKLRVAAEKPTLDYKTGKELDA